MKRTEVSAEYLQTRGWKPCYPQNSDIPYSWSHIVTTIKAGGKFVLETQFESTHGLVDGVSLMWRKATAEEIADANRQKQEARWKAASEKIDRRNIAKMMKRRRR